MAGAVPEGLGRLYPGHGPVVEDGPAKIQDYIAHRTKRIAQAVEVLVGASKVASGAGGAGTASLTLEQVTALMYPEIPAALIPPASVNTRQVLLFLQADGLVRRADDETWALVVPAVEALERVRAKM